MYRRTVMISLTALLFACGSTPIYRPAQAEGDIGYRVTELTEDKYRVSFRGSRSTSSETVRDFALLRAAEVTLQNGHDWFEVLHSDNATRERERLSTSSDLAPARHVTQSCGLLGCTTSVHSSYTGVRVETVRTDEYHSSIIEIAMGEGEPEEPRRVYDAAELATSIREAHDI